MNEYLTISLYNITKKYPIPNEHDDKVKHCKITADGSKAFYYDENYEFICEVKAKGEA